MDFTHPVSLYKFYLVILQTFPPAGKFNSMVRVLAWDFLCMQC